MVLDLNGTLVFRGGGRGNASEASRNPIRRPYLSSFLQYCLGLSDASYVKQRARRGGRGCAEDAHRSEQTSDEYAITSNIDEKAAVRRQKAWRKLQSDRTAELPHGSHFWHGQMVAAEGKEEASDVEEDEEDTEGEEADESNGIVSDPITQGTSLPTWKTHPLEPPSRPLATTRLLVWSSARPDNVDSMVRAMLHPVQAAQLVRCLARDTLVPSRFYYSKSPSVKDLEILWNALNLGGSENGDAVEKRLLANVRDAEDSAEDESVSLEAYLNGTKAIQLASSQSEGKGYGQHNTLLLDDSSDKARLQPYNHLLIPAFEKDAAMVAQAVRAEGDPSAEKKQTLDTVLLQTIGVIEHARWQCDISRWIYHGGLGCFAGMQHPGCENVAFVEGEEGEELQPRLESPLEERTETFWQNEGRRALRIRDIPVVI